MDLEDDFSTFLDTDEFASVATIAGKDIPVIFDAEYVAADVGGIDAEQAGPAIQGRTSDLEDVSHDQVIAVRSKNNPTVSVDYKAADRMPDGTGWTVIKLRLV